MIDEKFMGEEKLRDYRTTDCGIEENVQRPTFNGGKRTLKIEYGTEVKGQTSAVRETEQTFNPERIRGRPVKQASGSTFNANVEFE
jgi:hypothetical protein